MPDSPEDNRPSGSGDSPYYVVLFRATNESTTPIRQIITLPEMIGSSVGGCLPYGLDGDLLATLPALWYCLHLPRSRFDYVEVSPSAVRRLQHLDLSQHIRVVPAQALDLVPGLVPHDAPALVFCGDGLEEAATRLLAMFRKPMGIARFDELDDELLGRHWRQLGEAFGSPTAIQPRPNLDLQYQSAVTALPAFFTYRAFLPSAGATPFEKWISSRDPLRVALDIQSDLAMNERLEKVGRTHPSVDELKQESLRTWHTFSCPVSLAAPGVPVGYITREFATALRPNVEKCESAQESVIAFLTAHRAIARSGVAIVTRDVPDEAFNQLVHLERMWESWSGGVAQGRKVNARLKRIDEVVVNWLSEGERFALASASSLTAFTEFPLGLATMEWGSAPLTCNTPIAYRPLVPLTRGLQFESFTPPVRYLGNQARVLVAECIPRTDIVGRLSRVSWEPVANLQASGIALTRVDCNSVEDLRRAIRENAADILVISAHGVFNRRSNTAGLICGSEYLLDQELGELPPVVFLSACQVWPRGSGAVSIPSLLFRQGAISVTGPIIPVDVRHNGLLMTRFLANVADTLEGNSSHRTLQDVWHHTTTTNAINEMINSNASISRWAHEGKQEDSVLYEFMMKRSTGRLRGTHIYSDTETVLLEIARDRGVEDKVRAWLRSPGYVRESLFYATLGWPERIVVKDKTWDERLRSERFASKSGRVRH